jgi:tRNA(His) 5'-end guanylyltransferase
MLACLMHLRLLRLVQGTDAAAKNELLFKEFNINYNELPEQFKKVVCSSFGSLV